ncbi:MAG: putative virulence factor, partial [Deltaproteobacteria bacterium]|nr:putative virulence factor [Deltaproteobacteria bacterium]
MNLDELKDISLKIRKSTLDGEKWLLANEEAAGPQEVLRRRLRRSARFLSTYAQAAASKTGVAVFGPSQAGKSTLISALAKGPTGSLKVDFGPEILDYMTQINPEGGNETTGLVTRFSLDRSIEPPDPAMPVCLKLFSEVDIIKILANTYFGEAKGSVPIVPGDLQKALDALAQKSPVKNNLTLDDMEDLAEYVQSIAKFCPPGAVLESHYWPRAITLALKLNLADRAVLFSYLWGSVAEFSRLYMRLYKALELVDNEEIAFSGLNALYEPELAKDSRKNSVLHVDRLMGLLEEGGDQIQVINLKGKKASLTRPVLSALIAEIHVKVVEKPGEFMEYADILDFPGYRAREKLTNIAEEIKDPEILKKCFLRGKVAYLFERYCARHEITAMLLCIGDSVQNNPDLPAVIEHWISDSHGEQPEDRHDKPVCLFMVLTKFDRMLEMGAGSTDPTTRWDNRYNASFLQFFGNHSWPKQWSRKGKKTEPFNNIFWLLNLGYADAFFNLERTGGEGGLVRSLGLRSDQADWVEKVHEGYMASETTIKHVNNPEEAWQAIIHGSDGGAAYIIEKLTPILETDLKLGQLTHLVLTESQAVENTLRDFYQGGDKEEEKKIKEDLFNKIAVTFTILQKKLKVGLFLRSLILSDDECHAIFSQCFNGDDLAAPAEPAPGDPAAEEPEVDMMDLLFGGRQDQEADQESGQPSPPKPIIQTDDNARRYRQRLETAWQERLDDVLNDTQRLRYYGFPRDILQQLIAELVQGSRRLGVLDTVETLLRDALSYSNVNPERLLWKQSRLASAHLAGYISFLGLSPYSCPDQQRTVLYQGRTAFVFQRAPEPQEYPELPE